ncbi:hypothetical protein CCY99_00465 [Helicobacter sp. 16-1353]|uniref:Bax inhibitor-1/YccA family protein n=1 Tax=Helicobacter sp. 16-1353 TaxID=2004996 RepID=UPI000DCD1C4D|nr:Bax inhibitor-1/YccA family protein [Helicobacter sp. 16-1353]RAX55205.1 hypothetical protein CCY99_00465 [Helicobacter sp. 16-1353]
MSLYDRNYTRDTAIETEYSENTLVNFVKQTYKFFGASLLFATIGAYIGMGFAQYITKGVFIGIFVLEIALLFGLIFLKDKPIVNVIMLFSFTFVTGVALVPLLAGILQLPNGAGIVSQALLMTTIIFGVMSFFALKTKKDLASMGKMLFIALIVVVIASVVNLFLGSPLLQVIIAGVGAILFSIYIAYDTQNIIRGRYDSPIMAAISLYLDVYNLFISLLQILGIFSRE